MNPIDEDNAVIEFDELGALDQAEINQACAVLSGECRVPVTPTLSVPLVFGNAVQSLFPATKSNSDERGAYKLHLRVSPHAMTLRGLLEALPYGLLQSADLEGREVPIVDVTACRPRKPRPKTTP